MLLWIPAALAAPLAPSGLDAPGVEIAGFGGSHHGWIRQDDCAADACDAWQMDRAWGGEVGVGITKNVGLYAHGAHLAEDIAAARYDAAGYALGGGARLNVPLGYAVGIGAWAGVEHQLSGGEDLTERVTTWSVDAGVLLRGGRVDEGIQGWIGAGLIPWSTTEVSVLDGDLELTLSPRLPVEGVAGVMWISDPLFGPWDRRGRMGAGITGSAGYRTGFSGFLGFYY